MPTYSFTNPAASASDAIFEELLRRKAEARQAMLDDLTRQKVQAELENDSLTKATLADQRQALADERQQTIASRIMNTLTPDQDVSTATADKLTGAGYGDLVKTQATLPATRLSPAGVLAGGDQSAPTGDQSTGNAPPAFPFSVAQDTTQVAPQTANTFLGTHAQLQEQRQWDRLDNYANGSNDPKIKSFIDLAKATGAKPDATFEYIMKYTNASPTAKGVNAVQAENLYNPASGNAVYFKDGKYYDVGSDALVANPEKRKTEPSGEASQNAANNRMDKSYQYNDSLLEKSAKPIEDQMTRLGRLQQTIYQNSPQADALIAPELLSVMAGGQGSGVRMNEAEISRIVGGRSNWQSLEAALNKWKLDPTQALSVTPAQRQQISDLVNSVVDKGNQNLQIIDQARSDLINAGDVTGHRKVVADLKQKLSQGLTTPTPPPPSNPTNPSNSKYKVTIQD